MERCIYTYCFLRYDKVGGGFGLYSYSDNIIPYFGNSETLETLFGGNAYRIPKNRDVWISHNNDCAAEERNLRKYHPEKFAYQEMIINGNNRNDIAVLTFGRNLGRVTVGERVGNKVVYTLAGNPSEIKDYPCFYAGNRDFLLFSRDFFMRDPDNPEQYQDEVKPKKAKKLNSQNIEVGGIVTRESVHQFLTDRPERENILSALFYSLLNEHSGKQRPIIICDEKDNIIFWIAAVTLLFPLPIARKIYFNTYDYLGSEDGISVPDKYSLCGVYSPTANNAPDEEATNYRFQSFRNRKDIVLFDIEKNFIPEYESDDFFDIIHQFCMGNESLLMSYHEYIINHTSYRDYDKRYTEFYPVKTVKEELFSYYDEETKNNIVNEVYPYLFDSEASDSDMQKAISIVTAAYHNQNIAPDWLEEDFSDFAYRTIISNDEITQLYRAEPVIQLIGLTVKDLIKNCITDHKSEIWAILEDGSVPVRQLSEMLDIFDPYQYEDYPVVLALCDSLSVTDEGRKILSDTVKNWLSDGLNSDKPSCSPDSVPNLFRLDADNAKIYAEQTVKYFSQWNPQYQREFLSALLNSEFDKEFFGVFRQQIWNTDEPYVNVYHSVKLLYSINAEFADELYQIFQSKLTNESASVQKRIAEILFSDPASKYDSFYDKLSYHIYYTYSFRSENEIALFTYLYYRKLLHQNTQKFQFQSVKQSLEKVSCSGRKWKKAVENVKALDNDERTDSQIRRKMLEVFHSNTETKSVSDTNQSDKKGIFGNFKNKFKK